ncbi:MAG: MtaA/CmuA family methyltransferase [Nitrospirae bacterium]|nr:MAG: MtaA/CmuA family methyltransferase [Nitrospirota bacterium]
MAVSISNAKERIFRLFNGEEVDRPPCFSGMGNVTTEGLNTLGYKFAATHLDAKLMADAAASTYKLFGFECAVVPFDLCVEAEALGCQINVYAHSEDILYPTIKEKVIHNEEEMDIEIPSDLLSRGRISLVQEAIKILKDDIGEEVPVGTYVLGPFTLAGQIMELNDLLKLSFKKPDKVGQLLDKLADVIIQVAKSYEEVGVDYITVREMGATSDVLSPRVFKNLILPYLQKIFKELQGNTVLHICGKTNDIAPFMMESGTKAISVDQKNDIAETRKKLGPDALIFGNYDPYNVLVTGDEDRVRNTIRECIENGVSAVWPGCDIWPTVPAENMKAMMDEINRR